MSGPVFVYLHGFASSPLSTKAVLFRERLAGRGVPLTVPDLNEPEFRTLTLSRNLSVVDTLVPEGSEGILIGSSFGGYTAALFATLHPERVRALVLMAPALNMATLLRDRHGDDEMERWRREGHVDVDHPAYGAPQPLDWGLQLDLESWARQPVRLGCPTLVLHGRHDEDVPVSGSEALAARTPGLELVTYDAGHRLEEVTDDLLRRAEAFLAPWLS